MAKRQTDTEQKERAIGRWDNEGGAPATPAKRPKRPRDPNQIGKPVVDISGGDPKEEPSSPAPKNEAAAALGRIGSAPQAKSMSPGRRQEIARKAAKKR